jgi:hypothetical protein
VSTAVIGLLLITNQLAVSMRPCYGLLVCTSAVYRHKDGHCLGSNSMVVIILDLTGFGQWNIWLLIQPYNTVLSPKIFWWYIVHLSNRDVDFELSVAVLYGFCAEIHGKMWLLQNSYWTSGTIKF